MRYSIAGRGAPGDSISLRFRLLWLPKSAFSRCSYASNRFISCPTTQTDPEPLSGITDLEFHLEREHARYLRSSADFPQCDGPVNFDLVVSRVVSHLAPAVVLDAR
jgi:hypothetical protein